MKILHIDIETVPHLGYFWRLHKQYLTYDNIRERGRVICFAAKWDKKPEIEFRAEWLGGAASMASSAARLLDEADAVVHYNGKSFDVPWLNSLILDHGLLPPSPYAEIDLLDTVRKRFSFPNNRLETVARELGVGSKLPTKFELWKKVLEGDDAAMERMARYNVRDVRVQEKVYHKLLPWIASHPNAGLHSEDERPLCTRCGSHKIQYRGYYRTKAQAYRRFRCAKCGGWSRERFTALTLEQRKNVLSSL